MLLTNETFTLLPVEFSSIDDKQMRCIVNIRLWFLSHFIVILLIYIFLIFIYFALSFLLSSFFLFFPRFRSSVRVIQENIRLWSYEQEERSIYGPVLLIKEIALIFVYVLCVFSYK
jgi:hypothetical protein